MRSMTPVHARLYVVVRKIKNVWQVNDFHRTEGYQTHYPLTTKLCVCFCLLCRTVMLSCPQ